MMLRNMMNTYILIFFVLLSIGLMILYLFKDQIFNGKFNEYIQRFL